MVKFNEKGLMTSTLARKEFIILHQRNASGVSESTNSVKMRVPLFLVSLSVQCMCRDVIPCDIIFAQIDFLHNLIDMMYNVRNRWGSNFPSSRSPFWAPILQQLVT